MIDLLRTELERRPLRGQPAMLVAVALLGLCVLVWAAGSALGIPLSQLVRDPAAEFGYPRYAGLLSHMGVFALVASAACAFLVSVVDRRGRTLFRAVGGLSIVLAIDDVFLVHEYLPALLEAALFAIYGAIVILIAVELRRIDSGHALVGLMLALVLLAFSGIADLLYLERLFGYGIEDFAKLAGFGAWATVWIELAIARMRRAADSGAEPREAPSQQLEEAACIKTADKERIGPPVGDAPPIRYGHAPGQT